MRKSHLQNRPEETINQFVEFFNSKDVLGLVGLYHEDFINDQIAIGSVSGKEPVKAMFERIFEKYEMVCWVQKTFEDGEYTILECKDTRGWQGFVFIHIIDGKIKYLRLYSHTHVFL